MSTPVSIHDGPFTTNTLVSKKFLFIYFFIIWSSILPLLLEFYIFWKLINFNLKLFILVLPIQIYIGYIILVVCSIITSKIFLIIINSIHKPKEGVFERSKDNKDYYFWSLKAVIKKWPIWISKFVPLPSVNKINLRWFHNDSEFIEIGRNVFIGKGSSIKASMIFGNSLVIKKIKIEDNVIIGSNSFISPGTIICKNAIIGAMSVTKFNQTIKLNSIYMGYPAEELNFDKDSMFSIQNIKETISKNSDCNQKIIEKTIKKKMKPPEKKFVKNLKFNLFIFGLLYFISNVIPILGVIYFGFEFFIPYFLQSPSFYYIFLNVHSLTIFLITPLILIFLFLINILILVLITKLFYKIIKTSNTVKEGIFYWQNKNNNFNHYFKRSFLLRYIKWKLQKSPFPWLLNPAFNFIKNCKIGKNTVIEDSFIAKEFLEVGNNVYLGKLLSATHLWDKNLTIKNITIGENVTISDNCCIAPGTAIENNVSLFPLSVTAKFDKLKSNCIYYNAPLTEISIKKLNQTFIYKVDDFFLKKNIQKSD